MQFLSRLWRWPTLVALASATALTTAAVAWAATLETDAVLGTSAATPTTVDVGANSFDVKVWATGTVPSTDSGAATVTKTYNMAANGTITPDNTSTESLTFAPGTNFNTSKCNTSAPDVPASSCPSGSFANPKVVSATLNVASGTAGGTAGTLTVANAGSNGLTADGSPDTGYVKVAGAAVAAPTIGYTLNPASPDGSNGWYKSAVTLTWNVVGATSLTGCVNQNVVADQASTQYSCSASNSGGSAGPTNVSIKRDATAPTVARDSSQDSCSVPGLDGWCRGTQTAGFTASDATSGLASSAQSSFTKNSSTEGSNVNIASGSVSDVAGNTHTGIDAGPFKIDSTRPTITSSAFVLNSGGSDDGAYTADTWTNRSVRVAFQCNDGGSGTTATLTGGTVSTEGASQGVTSQGTCADAAGNQASPSTQTFQPIKIDKTKPVITANTGAYTPGSWTNGSVNVSFTCADAGTVQSGIASDTVGGGGVQNAETTSAGTNVTNTGSCIDNAGNVADAETVNVKIDLTKPVITADTGGYTDGSWTNQDVTVSFSCADGLSGKASDTVGGGGTFSTETDGTDVTNTGACADNAGNAADAKTVVVKIDRTKPAISADTYGYTPGSWTNQSVLVVFACGDEGSVQSGIGTDTVAGGGLQSAQSATTDGTDVTNTGSCVDRAGNSADAKTVNVKIDKTNPVVTVTGVTATTYTLGGVPAAGCSTTDALSGKKTDATLQGGGTGLGSHTAQCVGGEDNAGNTANSSQVAYQVLYGFSGLSAPIDRPTTLNVTKAGQALPLKWRLTDANGDPIATLASVKVLVTDLSCTTGSLPDLVEEVAAGSSGLQNLGDGYYQFNWKSPSGYANSCRQLKLDLGEGSARSVAYVQFKK